MALSSIIKEFGVRLGLDFNKAAADAADKKISEIAGNMRSLALEVSAVSASLLGFATLSARQSFALDTQSKQIGVTTDALQELAFAAQTAAGVSREELGGAMTQLSTTLFEAQNNSTEAGQALQRLGVVTSEELRLGVLKADVVIGRLADRFSKLPDGFAKTGLAASVGMERLLPLLNRGSKGVDELRGKARDLGVVMDKTMIQEGVKFHESLQSIWSVIKNVSFVIGNELIKWMQPVALEFQKWIVVNRKFLAQGLATALKQLGYYLGIVFKVARGLWMTFRELVIQAGGLERVGKVLATIFGVFAAIKLVGAVGGLVQSFFGLGKVLGLLLSPVGLISAALVALMLVVQDLFSDDSIIREWMDTFQDEFPQLAGLAQDWVNVMVSGANLIAEGWRNIWSWIQPVKDFLSSDVISNFMQKAEGLVGWLRGGGLGEKLFDMKERIFGPAGGITPTAAMSAASGGSQQTNNLQAQVTVMVPPGMSATQASEVVSSGVEDGFTRMLRNTRNQWLGGVAY